jgi:ribosomal protein S6
MDYPTESLGELERNLKLSDQVIRHLVVRLDE